MADLGTPRFSDSSKTSSPSSTSDLRCLLCNGNEYVVERREDGYTVYRKCPVCYPYRRIIER